jgi:hypothetical protein
MRRVNRGLALKNTPWGGRAVVVGAQQEEVTSIGGEGLPTVGAEGRRGARGVGAWLRVPPVDLCGSPPIVAISLIRSPPIKHTSLVSRPPGYHSSPQVSPDLAAFRHFISSFQCSYFPNFLTITHAAAPLCSSSWGRRLTCHTFLRLGLCC